jgi:hypothetical protein
MSIAEYIQQQVLLPRLKKQEVLVIYDPDQRYRELCLDMETEMVKVIDTSGSSILARETAIQVFNLLGTSGNDVEGMIVYIPTAVSETDEEKQRDPFAIYTTCGAIFPDGDGDEYQSLCLKAKPDQATEIRKIFTENPSPDFEVIDAVGGSSGWPNLQALLGAESSASDIIYNLLVPDEGFKQKLSQGESWVGETKELFSRCLGLKLITRGKTWSSIGDELWRFLLFSEFAYDLPEDLPDALVDVPRAQEDAKPLILDICNRLRNDRRVQAIYIDRAEAIETELELVQQCQNITDLGRLDTFPFEERSFLKIAIDALVNDQIDDVRSIFQQHSGSVWIGKGESQAQWDIIRSALHLCEACDDYEQQLSGYSRSLDELIDFYVNRLREIDRLQREFEQAVADYIDTSSIMMEVYDKARNTYHRLASKVQDIFIRHFENVGWPPEGKLANNDVFNKLVAPQLAEKGNRVAFLLVDALRYELGVALKKQLGEDEQVHLQPAFAQIPTTTKVGMASLLPDAGTNLTLNNSDNDLLVMLGKAPLTNVKQRMDVLKKQLGERFSEMILSDFLKPRKKVADSVDLLVLRSIDIDQHMENDTDSALRLIHDALKRIRAAIHKLKSIGFHEVVIATDHGFFLNQHPGPGGASSKPEGTWLNMHGRLLLGDGVSDNANFLLTAAHVGIRGDFNQVAGPRTLSTYRSGERYFHGGVSIQECVVPVMTISLQKTQTTEIKAKVTLSYKGGAKKITTRLPVVNVSSQIAANLFSQNDSLDILLEAHDKKGNVVGEAKSGGLVNPATGTINLESGKPVQITMKMQFDFEGKFSIKAINPTTLATYDTLELATDYMV